MSAPDNAEPVVDLGTVVLTIAVSKLAADQSDVIEGILAQHARGDWGQMSDGDKAMNDEALTSGERLHSAYDVTLSDQPVRLWVITEADRNVTTVLLPGDY